MATENPLNTLAYDPGRCTGCGLCAVVCPHGVFSAPEPAPVEAGRMQRLNARRSVARLVRPEACMECGACQLNCVSGAITVDSGVGCAVAMIRAALSRRRGEPSCSSTMAGGLPRRREAEC